jgi:hypothetical protein
MKLKNWREVLTLDFPSATPITGRTVQLTRRESSRFRGSMRISTGRIWTDREFEEKRTKVLNEPLP